MRKYQMISAMAEDTAKEIVQNETMHCWVNKGAKGIALLDEETYTGLKYVFDIEDVHKARRIGRFPYLWEMGEEHQAVVLDRLEKTDLGAEDEKHQTVSGENRVDGADLHLNEKTDEPDSDELSSLTV